MSSYYISYTTALIFIKTNRTKHMGLISEEEPQFNQICSHDLYPQQAWYLTSRKPVNAK